MKPRARWLLFGCRSIFYGILSKLLRFRVRFIGVYFVHLIGLYTTAYKMNRIQRMLWFIRDCGAFDGNEKFFTLDSMNDNNIVIHALIEL